ncbi:MAG: YdjY domain-containing protein [Planctomycetota bacterium]|nr:YdjY domain-containing protein [Planctomycetota bacterium]MDW8372238.1 YdjY domain-containing protein [Planctomycetota bacterium]
MRWLLLSATLAILVAGDPLAALPALPPPQPQRGAQAPWDPLAGHAIAPWLRFVPGERVVFDGVLQIERGPSDGLEVLACLREGKTHEALIRLHGDEGELAKAALLAAFGLSDGRPAEEGRGIPARGTPLRLTVLWRDEDGQWCWIDAACLVRDRHSDRPFPPLPWVWTGSRFLTVRERLPDGSERLRQRFMLSVTRSLAVNYDEPDALLASPFPCADEDHRFEAYSALTPPRGTALHLVVRPAERVLQLALAADGTLHQGEEAVDDAALSAALRAAFAGSPPHHAVFVRAPAAVGDETVLAARQRLLAAAAAAGVWAVPLFVMP